MEPAFAEMIGNLQAARLTVEGEMLLLAERGGWDRSGAGRLGQAAGTFAGQADALLTMMHDRNAEADSISIVEVLHSYFEDVRDLLEVDGDGDEQLDS
jgi:hypothetical protein